MNLYPNETWVKSGAENKTWAGFRMIPQLFAEQAEKRGCQILCEIQQNTAKRDNTTSTIRTFENIEPIILIFAILILLSIIVLYCFIIVYERFEFDSMKRGFTNQVSDSIKVHSNSIVGYVFIPPLL